MFKFKKIIKTIKNTAEAISKVFYSFRLFNGRGNILQFGNCYCFINIFNIRKVSKKNFNFQFPFPLSLRNVKLNLLR